MITAYHRPETLEQALRLLSRPDVLSMPLGGGTVLNRLATEPVEAVDLQALNLDHLYTKGKKLQLGATVTLAQLIAASNVLSTLKQAIRHQATYNLRQMATVAGVLVSADGRSPFATALLALGAELTIQPGDETSELGNFLPLRKQYRPGYLITAIAIPNNVQFAYQYVARTPADRPIVCVAVSQWPSGRTRVALGGYGQAPLLAMDGPEPDGAEAAARDAYREALDQWASAEYRSDIAGTLTRRAIEELS